MQNVTFHVFWVVADHVFSNTGHISQTRAVVYKKLSYRRGTARCVVSIEILPIATQQCRTTYTTSPDQIDGMKLEI